MDTLYAPSLKQTSFKLEREAFWICTLETKKSFGINMESGKSSKITSTVEKTKLMSVLECVVCHICPD